MMDIQLLYLTIIYLFYKYVPLWLLWLLHVQTYYTDVLYVD